MTNKIEALIAEFTATLRAAIAEEASATFAQIAGGGAPSTAARRVGKAGASPATNRPRKGKRARRSAEDIEKQAHAILAFVKKNPASKAELIGKSVGLSSLEMQIPIAQLLEEGSLKKKGERRGTSYTAK